MSDTKWTLDPAHTQIEFAVKHMMFTTVRGQFSKFEGALDLDRESPETSSIEVTIDASSIDTGVKDRDEHLRSDDFFDVQKFPEITFRSTDVSGSITEGDELEVTGDLTIRDVTREVTLDARFEGTGTDPWGGTRAGFTATTKIDRRDFGLEWNQALETGGVLVGHDITITLQVQAVLQEQAETATV